MTEPIYEFVKGQGWVIEPGILAYDRDGKQVRISKRKPQPGERYFKVHGSDYFDAVKHVRRYRLEQFPVCTTSDYKALLTYYTLEPIT